MNNNNSIIAKFSTFFIKRYRVTLLLFISILALGYASYSNFLKREGFPAIQVPIAIVQAPYFVDDIQKVDEELTIPLEKIFAEVTEVEEIRSTTTNNFALWQVTFSEQTTSKAGVDLLERAIEKASTLPANVEPQFITIDASKFDGKYDLILAISADKSIKKIQTKASEIAIELNELGIVAEAESLDLITEQENPITGEKFDFQASFNRVGTKQNGVIKFAPAVGIGIIKKGTGTDAIDLSDAIREKISELKKEGAIDGYEIVYTGDFAETLTDQISSLEANAISGLIAVLLVLYLFVNLRSALVTALFIPTVMAATFIGLYLIGYSLNIISLFSLILVLGLFVDDAIVVVEAIDAKRYEGTKGLKAVQAAISEIGIADISGTITTVLVFLPVAFTTGVLGDFIRLIPITVILALFLSLIIALSIITFFSFLIVGRETQKHQESTYNKIKNAVCDGTGKLVQKAGKYVARFVNWYLKKPVLTAAAILISLLLIAGGGYYAGKLSFTVFPAPKDTTALGITITYAPNTPVKQAEQIAQQVESTIVDKYNDQIDRITYLNADNQTASMNIELTPINSRAITSNEISNGLKQELANFQQARIKVSESSAGPPPEEFPFKMQVYSENPQILKSSTDAFVEFLTQKEIEDDKFVTEVTVDGLFTVLRNGTQRYAEVKAKITEPASTGLVLKVEELITQEYSADKLAELGLSEDALGFDLGQESDNIDSFQSVIFALLVAIILMYAILVLQYNSFLQPVLVFAAIPFSFPGLFPGLYLTDNSLSFFVVLGITGLVGIVVNNTIMLVDFANQARAQGKNITESITQAVEMRFRPIVTTSVTTIAGLLPLALSDPFWESLSFSIIFGLISSSSLVLLLFPSYYAVFEKIREFKDALIPSLHFDEE